MNAKKLVSKILVCGAGVLTLVSCSGKEITRKEAEAVLDKMNTAVTASSYEAPTKLTLTEKGTGTDSGTANYAISTSDYYYHYKMNTKTTDESGSVETDNGEGYIYISDDKLITADAVAKTYSETSTALIKTTVAWEAAVAVAGALPYGMLKSYSTWPSTLKASLVELDNASSTDVKDTYHSRNDTNLTIEMTRVASSSSSSESADTVTYSKFVMNNNLPTESYSKSKNGDTSDMVFGWGKVSVSKPDLSKYTKK
jgi:hypothetical protein